jgi:aminobenzoyl-glutamate utilization protein B
MINWSGEKGTSAKWVDDNAAEMAEMSDKIFSYAEPGLREYKSSKLLMDYLRRNGFDVEAGVSGMPTAFTSTWGKNGPTIGFFAEYDATPGHSQNPVPWDEPAVPYGAGFTDAHNMLGVAACFGAVALKETAEHHKLSVKIKLLGTPAEKLCVGKPFMARDGLFEGMDALLAWHPGGPTSVLGDVWPLTYMSMVFEFKVESASGGQSGDVSYPGALDAAMIMYNNVNTMKEHMPALMRRGGSINEFVMTGGQCTVSTPEFSQLVYAWRTEDLPDQDAIRKVIERCAQGAAIAADCKVDPRIITAVRTGLPNTTMTNLVMVNLMEHGPPRYTEEDKAFAREIQRNLGQKETEQPYDVTIVPPEKAYGAFHPADDVNEFTWHAPTARLYVSKAMIRGFRYPRWVDSALCGMGATHRMGETAAKVLAASAIDLVKKPEALRDAKTEFDKRRALHWEKPLMPDGVKPPVSLRWPEWVDRPGSEWWIPPPS